MVETRTRKDHAEEERQFQEFIFSIEKRREDEIELSISISKTNDSSKSNSAVFSQNPHDDVIMVDIDHDQSDDLSEKSIRVRQKQRRYDQFRKIDDTIIRPGEEPD